MKNTIKKVCAYCDKKMGEIPSDEKHSGISHGICDECIPVAAKTMGLSPEDVKNLGK